MVRTEHKEKGFVHPQTESKAKPGTVDETAWTSKPRAGDFTSEPQGLHLSHAYLTGLSPRLSVTMHGKFLIYALCRSKKNHLI